MQDCNVHTVLRLPRGTFTPYSQGVKANVVFLQKGPATEKTWIYDARSNVPGITKKDRPLTPEHLPSLKNALAQTRTALASAKNRRVDRERGDVPDCRAVRLCLTERH